MLHIAALVTSQSECCIQRTGYKPIATLHTEALEMVIKEMLYILIVSVVQNGSKEHQLRNLCQGAVYNRHGDQGLVWGYEVKTQQRQNWYLPRKNHERQELLTDRDEEKAIQTACIQKLCSLRSSSNPLPMKDSQFRRLCTGKCLAIFSTERKLPRPKPMLRPMPRPRLGLRLKHLKSPEVVVENNWSFSGPKKKSKR